MDAEKALLKYDRFDLDKFTERSELAGAHNNGIDSTTIADPVASSDFFWKVRFPEILVLFAMISIVVFEAFVLISMGVRSLRALMMLWLMWTLLAVNIALLIAIGTIVIVRRRGMTVATHHQAIGTRHGYSFG